jgi:kumamolisin
LIRFNNQKASMMQREGADHSSSGAWWRSTTTVRLCALLALVGSATVAVERHALAAPAPQSTPAAVASSPGALIGPTHVKSVSFMVLLRSSSAPTCLVRWAESSRLSVTWSTGQRWASISGAPRAVDRGFDVVIDDYRSGTGEVFYAANRPATVPSAACGEVAGVGTIHSFSPPTFLDVPQGGLSDVDLMRAYDALPLASKGFKGQGETVVFMELGGFLASDFTKFASDENLPGFDVTVIGKNPGFDDETTMDMETVHEIAPAAHLILFNLDSISQATSDADVFAQAITRAATQYPASIMSMSLGICENDPQAFDHSDLVALNLAVASAEAKGSTVFASSGDSGGLDCTPSADDGRPPETSFVGVSVPASLPAVTGVGGTALTTDASGNYVGETTWSEPLLSQGSGGGVSTQAARPSWQTGTGTGGQLDADNGRQVPDVSADADPSTGNFIVENGRAAQGGGTSLAAPIWAGLTAVMDQYLQAGDDPPVGFFNPILYHLASSAVPYPPFHDITVGGNDVYAATPGYDMVTGLGSPDVYNLARDLKAGKS